MCRTRGAVLLLALGPCVNKSSAAAAVPRLAGRRTLMYCTSAKRNLDIAHSHPYLDVLHHKLAHGAAITQEAGLGCTRCQPKAQPSFLLCLLSLLCLLLLSNVEHPQQAAVLSGAGEDEGVSLGVGCGRGAGECRGSKVPRLDGRWVGVGCRGSKAGWGRDSRYGGWRRMGMRHVWRVGSPEMLTSIFCIATAQLATSTQLHLRQAALTAPAPPRCARPQQHRTFIADKEP